MKVGDLVRCDNEIAIILEVRRYLDEPAPGHPLDELLWLKCSRCNGYTSVIADDEVRLINESR